MEAPKKILRPAAFASRQRQPSLLAMTRGRRLHGQRGIRARTPAWPIDRCSNKDVGRSERKARTFVMKQAEDKDTRNNNKNDHVNVQVHNTGHGVRVNVSPVHGTRRFAWVFLPCILPDQTGAAQRADRSYVTAAKRCLGRLAGEHLAKGSARQFGPEEGAALNVERLAPKVQLTGWVADMQEELSQRHDLVVSAWERNRPRGP